MSARLLQRDIGQRARGIGVDCGAWMEAEATQEPSRVRVQIPVGHIEDGGVRSLAPPPG